METGRIEPSSRISISNLLLKSSMPYPSLGGVGHAPRILCHISILVTALEFCSTAGLNTVNLHRYHLSSVGSFHQHHSFHQTGKPTFSLDSINLEPLHRRPYLDRLAVFSGLVSFPTS